MEQSKLNVEALNIYAEVVDTLDSLIPGCYFSEFKTYPDGIGRAHAQIPELGDVSFDASWPEINAECGGLIFVAGNAKGKKDLKELTGWYRDAESIADNIIYMVE